ncbi:hypothetical protein H0H81_001367 [Sphagnurus paluster]|uniref:Uncharacterized protein n=1 Tax=Sphagnurus paluster TaxID=117069 RepID=A0A9P7K2Y4_9AGAR|nr:hypothetical protein H0H81_001367 [Sphagnurus paluster]
MGNNNDGITVIDITNPEDPAFCFVSVNGLDAEEVPLMVPLSATSYVRAYYPAPRPNEAAQDGRMSEETIMKILSQLPSDRSVTLEMLAEAWPGDYLTEKDPEDCGFIPLAYSATMIETRKIPSLMELSLKPAIDHALDNDQTEYLQDLDFLSEKAQAIIEVFQSRKKIPDSGIALLATALGQVSDDTIDISHFSLSTDQIVNLISAFPNLKTLKLSHNPAVTVDTIHAVLSSKPKIKRLVALDTCITNESLSTLLSTAAHLFLHLDAFIHCFFFTGKSHFPSAFSFIGSTSTSRSNLYGASLPFFSPALVVQALTDYFCKINYLDRLQGTGMQCQATLSTEVRKPGETWLNRSVPLIAPFSLRALSGEGWFFAYSSPEYNRPASYFAFAQAAEPGGAPSTGGASADPVSGSHFTAKKIVDLKGFLLEMESEGREPAPAAAVEALQKIFQQLGEDSNHNLKLMDEEQLKTFCQNALSAK